MSDAGSQLTEPITYRLALPHLLRIGGPSFIAVGVWWIVLVATGSPAWVKDFLAVVTIGLALAGVVFAIRPPVVLRLDKEGYHISFVRGAGNRDGAWVDVTAADLKVVARAPSLVLTMTDGSTGAVPLTLLGKQQGDAQVRVHALLNAAHGYRPLESP